MFSLITRLLINAFALILTTMFVPGLHLARLSTAVWAALVWGLVNALIRPLLSFLTLPLQFLTLGLFTIMLNGLMLALTAALVPGFHIRRFSSAVIGALLLSLISFVLTHLIH